MVCIRQVGFHSGAGADNNAPMMVPFRKQLAAALQVACCLAYLPTALLAETFVRSTNGEVETLDPHKVSSSAEGPITIELFEGLTTVDVEGNIIPGAASGWEISEDGLAWTFTLREGLEWSDGTPMTAEDFVWSLRRALDPATLNPQAGRLFVIAGAREVVGGERPPSALGVAASDDSTVVIRLEHPAPYLGELLFSNGLPVPRHAIDEHGSAWTQPGKMVSNGAFVLTERVPQSHVAARRNPRFRDAASVALEEVRFVANEDLTTGVNRFRAGEIHMALNFPQRQLDFLRENYPDAIRLAPFLGYDYYALNTEKPPFNDRRVRKALSMAIDREVLANRIMRTGDQPAYSYVAPGTENYPHSPQVSFAGQPMKARQEKARALLEQAGFGSANPLTVELRFNSRDDIRSVAVAVAAMWRQIGVRTELLNSESRAHVAELVNGSYQAGRWLGFADYNDPMGFLQRFVSDSSPANNISRYKNPRFDELIERANQTADIAQRAELLAQAESVILEDHPIIPLYFIVSKRLVSADVEGWVDNLRGAHLLRYVSFRNETD